MENLAHQLKTLPKKPGVYLFKDAQEKILYVGKAKLLSSRVRSYFRPSANLDEFKRRMIPKVAHVETIATDTETEALVLEANLIRQNQPPYNVLLRDDKYYLFIKITTNEETPRVFPVRKVKRDGARYFGPYSSARSVRATLRLLRRIFPHKGEKESSREQIFPHPLFAISHQNNIQNIIRFLAGRRGEIFSTLSVGMEQAAAQRNFEQAAIFRDQLQAINRLEGSQKVLLPRKESFDIVSLARSTNKSAANVFQIRDGKLLGKNTFLLQHRTNALAADVLRQFLLQYYRVAQDIPKIVLIPASLTDEASIAKFLNLEFAIPHRGKKKQLLAMGELNAQQLLREEEVKFQTDARLQQAQQELFRAVGVLRGPRIETYDISNIQGSLATASMIVFENGKPNPRQYRKFRLKLTNQPNDYAMLQETLRRRFSGRHPGWKKPDLIIIDGGKGQLSSTKKILDELKVKVPVISIAKREEEIFVPGRPEPVRLPHDSAALFLIQRTRDEAHRFTISYHRLLRSKKQRHSLLDEIPGIGPKAKKRLLNHFGSLKNIRAATREDLAAIVGPKQAETIQDYV